MEVGGLGVAKVLQSLSTSLCARFISHAASAVHQRLILQIATHYSEHTSCAACGEYGRSGCQPGGGEGGGGWLPANTAVILCAQKSFVMLLLSSSG